MVTFDARQGTTYYIAVSAYRDAVGDIRLTYSLELPPEPVLSSLSLSGAASVRSGASATYTCTAHYSDGHAQSVQPSWALSAGGSYATISGNGVLSARETTVDRSVTIQASYGGQFATKSVTITGVVVSRPPNDDFANATVLTGHSGQVSGSNRNATGEQGEPNHGNRTSSVSIWWKWSCPATGRATVHTGGSTIDTLLGVYTGTRISDLTTIASDDDGGDNRTSRCSFDVTRGTTYYIAVSAYENATGDIRLTYSVEGGGSKPAWFDPIAYYPFDNQSVQDASGHGNHLRPFGNGSIGWRTGKTGSACHFDGTAQLGSESGTIVEARGSFTIAFWVKPEKNIVENFQVNGRLSQELWGADTPFALYPGHGGNQIPAGTGVAVGMNGIAVVEHTGNYFPVTIAQHVSLGGRWTHVAVTVANSGDHILYVNGQQVASGINGGQRERFVRIISDAGIGGNRQWPFAGDLDEFMIFDRSLSSSEIKAIYENPGLDVPVPCVIGGSPDHPLRPDDGPGVEFVGNAFHVRFRAPEQGRRYVLESATDLRGPFSDTGVSRTSSSVDELIDLVDRSNPLSFRLHYYRIRIE